MPARGGQTWKGDVPTGSGTTFRAGDTFGGEQSYKSCFEEVPGTRYGGSRYRSSAHIPRRRPGPHRRLTTCLRDLDAEARRLRSQQLHAEPLVVRSHVLLERHRTWWRGPSCRSSAFDGANAPCAISSFGHVFETGRRESTGVRSDTLDVCCLEAFRALVGVELDLLSLVEVSVAVTSDSAEVHEHIRPAGVLGDEPEAFLAVEPFHGTSCHSDPLPFLGHSRPTDQVGDGLARCEPEGISSDAGVVALTANLPRRRARLDVFRPRRPPRCAVGFRDGGLGSRFAWVLTSSRSGIPLNRRSGRYAFFAV